MQAGRLADRQAGRQTEKRQSGRQVGMLKGYYPKGERERVAGFFPAFSSTALKNPVSKLVSSQLVPKSTHT